MSHISTLSSFRILYDEKFNNLVIYSIGMGIPYDQAKDIVQECFIKLWENRENVSNPVSYLFTSVRNSSLNYLKAEQKSKGKVVAIDEVHHIKVDDSAIDAAVEYYHKVEEAYKRLQELTGRCKDIFVMVYIEKMKIREVAEELAISENTVKTYLKRAKDALRILSLILILFL